LKVCFLSPALPGADPGDAVGEHARRLAADHGLEVTVALSDPPAGGAPARLGEARLLEISDALAERYDIAVATHWQATVRLFELDAGRYASLVERLEHHYMDELQANRIAAALSYDLPVDFLAASEHVAEQLCELRPDARCVLAPLGVAKDVFMPGEEDGRGPLRVAVSGDQSAVAVVQAMAEPRELEVIDPASGATVRAAGLAAADVALVLGADDRLAREAVHAGAACVATVEGVVEHDRNGLVTAPHDVAGAARALDLLTRDRELLARLRAGALETARGIPALDTAAAAMARALELLVAEPPPEAARWPVRLMADATALATVFDNELQFRAKELERINSDAAHVLAARAREVLEQPRLAPARRLVRAARRRRAGG
jgi:hypothetical protein